MTTPRENLLKVYRHEIPDWIPLVGMVDNYQVPIGLPEEFESNLNIVSFSRHFGLDIIERYDEARYEKMNEVRRYEMPLVREKYRNVGFRVETNGAQMRKIWETPFGEIEAAFANVQYNVDHNSGVATEFPTVYPVKGPGDFKAFQSIFEDMEYEIDLQAVPFLDRRIAEIGDGGITTLAAPSSPLGMCVRYYMSIETLAMAYHTAKYELRELLEAIGENFLRKLRLLASLNADGVISFDDTTTRAISPTMFAELEIPYINNAAAIVHGRNKIYIHHSCGHIHHLLDLYRQTDMDAVDLLTVKPLGDCTIADAKQRLSPDIVMMPGFETHTMDHGTPDEIRAMVRQFYLDARPGDNFIPVLYPQPNTSTVERLEIVVEEANKWRLCVG